jgi:hypothetical protein
MEKEETSKPGQTSQVTAPQSNPVQASPTGFSEFKEHGHSREGGRTRLNHKNMDAATEKIATMQLLG